jgi:hypothetical protein
MRESPAFHGNRLGSLGRTRVTIPLTYFPAERTCAGAAPLPHLTTDEQRLILRATAGAFATTRSSPRAGNRACGSRVVGPTSAMYTVDGRHGSGCVSGKRSRRAAEWRMFLPDRLVAKLKRFWRWKWSVVRIFLPHRYSQTSPAATGSVGSSSRGDVAAESVFDRVRVHALRHTAVTNATGRRGTCFGAEVCEAPKPVDDDGVHPPWTRDGPEGAGAGLLNCPSASSFEETAKRRIYPSPPAVGVPNIAPRRQRCSAPKGES